MPNPDAAPARLADAGEVDAVGALLAGSGVAVSVSSLAERIASDAGGVLLTNGACVSYALDAGALHAYDFAGNRAAFGALVAALAAVAQAAFAAVIATTLYDDDPLVATLLTLGFTIDWSEADVRDGKPASIVGLLREVV